MKQVQTQGIVLKRTSFGEADRIITVITPDHGKVSLLAKGVRKSTSKLAGGIELFSVSNLGIIFGKGEVSTLISTRLVTHYANIVKELDRTMLTYELMKRLDRATEDATGPEYFELMQTTLAALDNVKLTNNLIELWFDAQLLKLGGHQPNLTTDLQGQSLKINQNYTFDLDKMAFVPKEQGSYRPNHVKFLRLVFGAKEPLLLAQIKDADSVTPACQQLVKAMLHQFVRI